jgi:dihydroorotate dehydrogenase electron transfer subunit
LPERFAKTSVVVLSNERVAPGHFVTTFADPEIGGKSGAGQFYQVRLKGANAPFLPRPFSIFDWHRDDRGEVAGFKILYKVVGQGTEALSGLPGGDSVAVTGPLGNTFDVPGPDKRVLVVAGGIGIAPFLAFVRTCLEGGVPAERIRVLYGARSQQLLVAVDAFESLDVEVSTATDDGSSGVQGTAVGLVEDEIARCGPDEALVYASGPTPMLEALILFCRRRAVRAQLSLEARMACGIAVCNSCATRVISDKDKDGWDYKLVCRDGPVFNAEALYVEAKGAR